MTSEESSMAECLGLRGRSGPHAAVSRSRTRRHFAFKSAALLPSGLTISPSVTAQPRGMIDDRILSDL
ncbi:unnamed protein product, partial [Iphiclides podalirius]